MLRSEIKGQGRVFLSSGRLMAARYPSSPPTGVLAETRRETHKSVHQDAHATT